MRSPFADGPSYGSGSASHWTLCSTAIVARIVGRECVIAAPTIDATKRMKAENNQKSIEGLRFSSLKFDRGAKRTYAAAP